ncbi:MAG: N-acetylmuramoyl-L-alanine amidase family protein, partial [Planctomycetota bacterium]
PRYEGGALVVPPGLADVVRRLGRPSPGAAVPPRIRPEPGVRPRTALAPAPTSPALAILGSLRRETVAPGGRRGPGNSDRGNLHSLGRAVDSSPSVDTSKGNGKRKIPEGSAGFLVVDPGHGGRDEGARGKAGTKEKDVVLDIAKRTAVELRRKGVRVNLTRKDDRYLTPTARVRTSNSLKPDALVSLHTNSYRQASVSGVETWVYSRQVVSPKGTDRASRKLAKAVQSGLVRAMGSRDRGVRRGTYQVLRRSKVPAALVEIGFISNAADEKKLADAKWREKIAKALAKAILGSGVLKKRKKQLPVQTSLDMDAKDRSGHDRMPLIGSPHRATYVGRGLRPSRFGCMRAVMSVWDPQGEPDRPKIFRRGSRELPQRQARAAGVAEVVGRQLPRADSRMRCARRGPRIRG